MGRNVGIEPTHTGATNQRVNHFTNSAITTNNDSKKDGNNQVLINALNYFVE